MNESSIHHQDPAGPAAGVRERISGDDEGGGWVSGARPRHVLQTIRRVNHLIVHESDPKRLADEVCACLPANLGYRRAWIALLDESGERVVHSVVQGFEGDAAGMGAKLAAGHYPTCMRAALASPGRVVVSRPLDECPECPLDGRCEGDSTLTMALTCDGDCFGVVAVCLPDELVRDPAEHDLLAEVAGDLAFAMSRRRDADRLAESERALATLVANLPGMVYRCRNDADWTMVNVSEGARDLTGFEPHELIGNRKLSYADLIVEEDRDKVWDFVQSGIVSRGPFELEYRIRCADGRVKWVWERGRGVFSPEGGDLLFLEGFITDITERREAEDLMRIRLLLAEKARTAALDEFLQAALDEAEKITGSRIAFFHFVDEDQENLTLAMWSTATVREFCHAEGQGMHYPISQAGVWTDCLKAKAAVIHNDYASLPHRKGLPPGHAPIHRQLVVPVMRNGLVVAIMGVGNKEDDYGAADVERVETVAEVVVDLALRKRAQEALRESEARFRAISELSHNAIAILDDKGRIVWVNPRMEQMCGVALPDLRRVDSFLPFIAPESQAVVGENFRAFQEGRPYEHFCNLVFLRPDGQRRMAEKHMTDMVDKAGRRMLIVSFLDVTERQKAEEDRTALQGQLLQAQRLEAVGRLAGGVAHDFNNILGIIFGHVELALEALPSDHPMQGNLQEILKASRRSADLTRQLLAFARKQAIVPQVLDLNDTIGSMLKMLRRLIGEDVDLIWKPGLEVGAVRMDPTQIDQILANLVVNARDAIPGVGWISIETERVRRDEEWCCRHEGMGPGEYVVVAVKDNGSGMDAETMAHVFEPFFTTKELGKGTGLGLATVYGIVQQNHGCITVRSVPGAGSEFEIHLPAVLAKAEAAVVSRDAAGPLPTGSETVLIVEDEESMLALGANLLRRLGYQVLMAGSPSQALAAVRSHNQPIHLLLTDVVMPEMSGRDLARHVLSLRPEMKVVYVSGYTGDFIAERGVLGADLNFLQKPFPVRTLAEKLREVLDGREAVKPRKGV